jgi:hypothetical protein
MQRTWPTGIALTLSLTILLPATAGLQDLPSPYVITGRVVDGAGSRVAGTFVTALEPRRGETPFRPVSVQLHATTNELGEFRLEGLHPGEFYVIAIPRNVPLDGRPRRFGYRNTFHPSAATPSEAKLVRVTFQPGIANITLRPASLGTISGVVIQSNGRSAEGGTLRVAHGDGLFGLASRGLPVRPDGTFTAPALQPGTYFLQFREGVWPPSRDTIPKVSVATVTVAGSDVGGVRVAPVSMVRATGRVIVDAVHRPRLQPATIVVAGAPSSFEGMPGPQRPGRVAADLTFEFRTWPGRGRIRVRTESTGWIVTSVRWKGVDITDKEVQFAAREDLDGLEVHLTRR